MITLNCIHHASHLMNTLTFNTCQFLHWNYIPWTQYMGPLLSIFVLFFSIYIFTCQTVVGVLLTLTRCIGDTHLLTILTYIKDYNPKLLVIIIIIIIVKSFYPPLYSKIIEISPFSPTKLQQILTQVCTNI